VFVVDVTGVAAHRRRCSGTVEVDANVLTAARGRLTSGCHGVVEGNVPVTVLEATASRHSAVAADANVSLTGVSATGQVGSVTVIEGSGVDVFVTGVSATGLVRPVLVWGRIVPDPGTVYTEITPSAGTIWTEIAA
jgi:hypothetical protein